MFDSVGIESLCPDSSRSITREKDDVPVWKTNMSWAPVATSNLFPLLLVVASATGKKCSKDCERSDLLLAINFFEPESTSKKNHLSSFVLPTISNLSMESNISSEINSLSYRFVRWISFLDFSFSPISCKN